MHTSTLISNLDYPNSQLSKHFARSQPVGMIKIELKLVCILKIFLCEELQWSLVLIVNEFFRIDVINSHLAIFPPVFLPHIVMLTGGQRGRRDLPFPKVVDKSFIVHPIEQPYLVS